MDSENECVQKVTPNPNVAILTHLSPKMPKVDYRAPGDMLEVVEAKLKDFGRGIARIDPRVMEILDLHAADVIQVFNLVGGARTAVKIEASYPEDIDTDMIRLDRYTREILKVGINSTVTVRKIKAVAAESVEITPIQPLVPSEKEKYFGLLLENRVLSIGDTVRYSINGQSIEYAVTDFAPKTTEAVISSADTKIEVRHDDLMGGLFQRIHDYPQLTEGRTFRDILKAFIEDILDNWEKFSWEQKQGLKETFIRAACDAFRDLLG